MIRICEHGRLANKCETCQSHKENLELQQQLAAAQAEAQVITMRAENAEAALVQAERELERLREWCAAIMPRLEQLLQDVPNALGIDGNGSDCWPVLAEFVTKGRALAAGGS